jgi:hypothetical protein
MSGIDPSMQNIEINLENQDTPLQATQPTIFLTAKDRVDENIQRLTTELGRTKEKGRILGQKTVSQLRSYEHQLHDLVPKGSKEAEDLESAKRAINEIQLHSLFNDPIRMEEFLKSDLPPDQARDFADALVPIHKALQMSLTQDSYVWKSGETSNSAAVLNIIHNYSRLTNDTIFSPTEALKISLILAKKVPNGFKLFPELFSSEKWKELSGPRSKEVFKDLKTYLSGLSDQAQNSKIVQDLLSWTVPDRRATPVKKEEPVVKAVGELTKRDFEKQIFVTPLSAQKADELYKQMKISKDTQVQAVVNHYEALRDLGKSSSDALQGAFFLESDIKIDTKLRDQINKAFDSILEAAAKIKDKDKENKDLQKLISHEALFQKLALNRIGDMKALDAREPLLAVLSRIELSEKTCELFAKKLSENKTAFPHFQSVYESEKTAKDELQALRGALLYENLVHDLANRDLARKAITTLSLSDAQADDLVKLMEKQTKPETRIFVKDYKEILKLYPSSSRALQITAFLLEPPKDRPDSAQERKRFEELTHPFGAAEIKHFAPNGLLFMKFARQFLSGMEKIDKNSPLLKAILDEDKLSELADELCDSIASNLGINKIYSNKLFESEEVMTNLKALRETLKEIP